MPHPTSAKMTQARFAAIVEAYGADAERWPAAEKEAAKGWLALNPLAQTLLSQSNGLDRILCISDLPAVSATLERRMMEDFDRARQRWSLRRLADVVADAVWPGGPLWQPACAFGLALAAGLGIALFAPFDIPQQDEASSSVFALDTVSDADAGHGI
jgi:hypothetical protein